MTIRSRCGGVQSLASLYVDDRLAEGVQRDLEAHLARCPACQAEVHTLRELCRRTRELSATPLEDGFAARTLERARAAVPTISRRSRAPVWPTVRPFAAGFLMLLALAGSYWLGRFQGQDEATDDGTVFSVRPDDLVRPVRAARALASDLGVIDRIPEPLQRPILRAQIQHFDLVRWAERVTARPEAGRGIPHRGLATLVLDVESTLDEGAPRRRLLELKARVLSEEFWKNELRALPVSEPEASAPRRRRAVVATVGGGLSAEVRDGLELYLCVKESCVEGRVGAAVTLSRDLELEMPDLRSMIQVSLARCLDEAGLAAGAQPILEELELDMPDVSSLLRMTFGSKASGLRGFGGLRDIRSHHRSIFFGQGPDGASFRVIVTPDQNRRER